jgi:hypothetical protein
MGGTTVPESVSKSCVSDIEIDCVIPDSSRAATVPTTPGVFQGSVTDDTDTSIEPAKLSVDLFEGAFDKTMCDNTAFLLFGASENWLEQRMMNTNRFKLRLTWQQTSSRPSSLSDKLWIWLTHWEMND